MKIAQYYYHSLVEECLLKRTALELLGLSTVLLCCLLVFNRLVWVPFKLYVLAQVLPGVDLKSLGRWAVVTGSTDGIGKQYAIALAKRGLDVVLISRSPQKLKSVAEEIKSEHQVQVKTITADFTDIDVYDNIASELEGLDIGVLVNNVAVASETSTFLKTPNLMTSMVDMIHVNCLAATKLSAIVLPDMLQKRRGILINVSSVGSAGFIGGSVYSATKAYISRLSDCLQRTYRNSGVIIQTVEPGMVDTNMLGEVIRDKSPNIMKVLRRYTAADVKCYANSALNTVGWTDLTHGHVIHYLSYILSLAMPQSSGDESLLSEMD